MRDGVSLILRSRKLWGSLLFIGLAWMWWSAMSNKPVLTTSAIAMQIAPPAASRVLSLQEQFVLPTRIERESLKVSNRDPFALLIPPVPNLPQPKKALLQTINSASLPPFPLASAAPSPPPLNLRFVGQATTPDGERLIYAAIGDASVLLAKGISLPNGYQVISIEPKVVNLVYTPLNFSAQLILPESPRYEIR